MRVIAFLMVLVIVTAARAQVEQRVILLRGRYKAGGPAIFNYAGEMQAGHGVEAASRLGLTDAERLRLERVVARYQRGVNPSGVGRPPLYVLLNDDGSAVSVRDRTEFTMIYPNGGAERLGDGFVDVGSGAPERPFTSPWWAWLSGYNSRLGWITFRRPVTAMTSPATPAGAPAAPVVTHAVPQPMRLAAVTPRARAAAPSSTLRSTIYPMNYTYVAPPRPAIARTTPVRFVGARTTSSWRPAAVSAWRPAAPVWSAPAASFTPAPVQTYSAPVAYVHHATYASAPVHSFHAFGRRR